MPRIGTLGLNDLRQTRTIEEFRLGLAASADVDLFFRHAPEQIVSTTPGGLARGVRRFGPGTSPVLTNTQDGKSRMRDISSIILNDSMFVVSSMSIVDRQSRVFVPGVENLGKPTDLANFDPHYSLDGAGNLVLDDTCVRRAKRDDGIAAPVCGVGFNNYGHFLYDGLPGIFLQRQMLPEISFRIVGPPLTPWQADILSALNLEDCYQPVREPTIFAKLMATTMLALHVSYPTGFIRPMFDTIRFRFGATGAASRRIFLSRGGDTTRRVLRNRVAVEARLAAAGFEIIHPGGLSFRQQVRLMSDAKVIVAESGAALANIGFCQPGAVVLEIQPECFVEGWTRGVCFQLAHEWNVYFAAVAPPDRPDVEWERIRAAGGFSFELDVDDLLAAVNTVVTRAAR